MDKRILQFAPDMERNLGASEELMREDQAKLGISLPRDYPDFIRMSNGAEGPIGTYSYLQVLPIESVSLHLALDPATKGPIIRVYKTS